MPLTDGKPLQELCTVQKIPTYLKINLFYLQLYVTHPTSVQVSFQIYFISDKIRSYSIMNFDKYLKYIDA